MAVFFLFSGQFSVLFLNDSRNICVSIRNLWTMDHVHSMSLSRTKCLGCHVMLHIHLFHWHPTCPFWKTKQNFLYLMKLNVISFWKKICWGCEYIRGAQVSICLLIDNKPPPLTYSSDLLFILSHALLSELQTPNVQCNESKLKAFSLYPW